MQTPKADDKSSLLHKPPKLAVSQEWLLAAAATEEITENNAATKRRRSCREEEERKETREKGCSTEFVVSNSEEKSIYRAPRVDSFKTTKSPGKTHLKLGCFQPGPLGIFGKK
ncbi:hypothetical protein M9H77_18202 [Catharanthus roseus]|uniref:Uncharacterized protein n=1 Tax=Catharanthus roseus TaxID=4058 RepID=A0ACC0B6U3_CATRO|nr:hypothetical protein M9H77_18202 [Catharanthus roseus]